MAFRLACAPWQIFWSAIVGCLSLGLRDAHSEVQKVKDFRRNSQTHFSQRRREEGHLFRGSSGYVLGCDFQDYFAVILPLFQKFVGFHRALEWKHLSDLRRQLPFLDPTRKLLPGWPHDLRLLR